jgi:hypothetical protein
MLYKIKYNCTRCNQEVDAERDCWLGLRILPHTLLEVPCVDNTPKKSWEPPKTMTLPRFKNNKPFPDIREILLANPMKPPEE